MAAKPKPRAIELTDPRALRALAHPARLALVGLLRREGPLTATQAATHLDDSPSNLSFHLRQLARYGLVKEAGGGHGRERPWQATATFTNWPTAADDPDVAAAADQLSAILARRYFDLLIAWIGLLRQRAARLERIGGLRRHDALRHGRGAGRPDD